MSKHALLRLALVIATAALTAFLYFSPKTNLAPARSKTNIVDFGFLLEKAKQKLQRQEISTLSEMENLLKEKSGDEKVSVLNSLAARWDGSGEPAIAAGYFEQAAEINPSEKYRVAAADRYFAAMRNATDSTELLWLLNRAIENYKSESEINPDNTDAKINLAICYTETSNPMNGIMILREVVQQHPDNLKAQMNLGLLSIRSGQFDKAIERFKKVIEIDPGGGEAYYFLGYSYMKKGENADALDYFNQYTETGKDTQLINEANVYIRQLKP